MSSAFSKEELEKVIETYSMLIRNNEPDLKYYQDMAIEYSVKCKNLSDKISECNSIIDKAKHLLQKQGCC